MSLPQPSSTNAPDRVLTWTLLCASTMTVLAGATIAPALPQMKAHFSDVANAEFLVKLVMTITGLTIAVCAPLAGILCDKWRKTLLLSLCMILYGLSGVAGFFLQDNLMLLVASRAILGVAVAGIMVSVTTLASDYFTQGARHKYMGLQAAFGGFGGVVFVGLASLLAQLTWQLPFLIYATAFVVVPFVLIYLYEPTVQPVPKHGETNDKKSCTRTWVIIFCCGWAFVEVFSLYMIPVHFPFFAQSFTVSETWQVGFMIAYMLLVMSCCSVMYHHVKARWSFLNIQLGGMVLIALGFVALSEVTTILGALAALTIAGSGFGLVRPNLVLWMFNEVAPSLHGRVMGGITSCYFLAQFMVPVVTQPYVATWGYARLFFTAGVLLFLLAVAITLGAAMTEWLKNRDERAVRLPAEN